MESQDLAQPSIENKKKRLFTEKAITVGTVLGGPLLGSYLISENFKALNKDEESKKSLIIGIIVTILFFPLLVYIPGHILDNIPDQLFHLVWAGIVFLVVKKYQRENIKSHIDNGGEKGSGWVVFLASTVGTVITFGYGFLFLQLISSADPVAIAIDKLVPYKVEFTQSSLYYDSLSISEQDAKIASIILFQVGYFNDEYETVGTYYKKNEKYCIKLFVDEISLYDTEYKNRVVAVLDQFSKRYIDRKFKIILVSTDVKNDTKEIVIE